MAILRTGCLEDHQQNKPLSPSRSLQEKYSRTNTLVLHQPGRRSTLAINIVTLLSPSREHAVKHHVLFPSYSQQLRPCMRDQLS